MKKLIKIFQFIFLLTIILGLSLSLNGIVSQASTSNLKVSSPKSVPVNCSIKIKTNTKSYFKSSNKKIATVNSNGIVKGKKAGTVKIAVTSKKNKKQCKVLKITVKNQLVITSPTTNQITMYVGKQRKIKTNLSATYKSSNKKIATVNSKGIIKAKKPGTVKITVQSKKYKKLKKTLKVIVKKKATSEVTTTEQTTTEQTTTEQTTTEQTTTEQTTTEQTTTEQTTTEETIPEAPTFTIDYTNGTTVQIVPETVEYCIGENAFELNNEQIIYKGDGNTISVEPGKNIYFRYCATATQKASQVFILEPVQLQLESIGIATVECYSSSYDYRYEIRTSEDGVKYDIFLSDTRLEDTSNISSAQIQTITYETNKEYYVASNTYYQYIYVRLSGTDTAFASDWVLASKISVDNEFDIDDIP